MTSLSEILFVFWLWLIAVLDGYREIIGFVDYGVWVKESTWLPNWGVRTGWKKMFNAYHSLGGANKIIFAIGVWCMIRGWIDYKIISFNWAGDFEVIVVLGLYVWFFYWQRNWIMHIWGRTEGHRELKYLSPINF